MAKRKTNKKCYYCGMPANSYEHAPPKQMFKGFSCDSITVPSCEKHNTSKSKTDQAIVSAFLIPLVNSIGKYPIEENVFNAICAATSLFDRTKRYAIERPLLNNPPEWLQDLPDLAYLLPEINIEEWVKQLTAALIYNAIKFFDSTIDWPKIMVWSPNWLPTTSPNSLTFNQARNIILKNRNFQSNFEEMAWINGWSAYPTPYPTDIYRFQINIESGDLIIIKHVFYGRYKWFTWFFVPQETRAKLTEKLFL